MDYNKVKNRIVPFIRSHPDKLIEFIPQKKLPWEVRPIVDAEIGDEEGKKVRMVVFATHRQFMKAMNLSSHMTRIITNKAVVARCHACVHELAYYNVEKDKRNRQIHQTVYDKRYIAILGLDLEGLNQQEEITHECGHLGFYHSSRWPNHFEKRCGVKFNAPDAFHRPGYATAGVQESICYPSGIYSSYVMDVAFHIMDERRWGQPPRRDSFKVIEDNRHLFVKQIRSLR